MSDRPPHLPETPTNITQYGPPAPQGPLPPQPPYGRPNPNQPDYGPPPRPPYLLIGIAGAIGLVCVALAGLLLVALLGLSGGSDDEEDENLLDLNTRAPQTDGAAQADPTTTHLPAGNTSLPTANIPTVAAPQNPNPPAQATHQCPGTAPSLLNVGQRAQVTTTGQQIFADAAIGVGAIGTLVPGMVIDIFNGPRCSDNATWWYVRYGITSGWVQETAGPNYFLASAEQQLSTLGPVYSRTTPPVGARVLSGGIGLSDRSAMPTGEFQVEWYCNILNFGVTTDNNHWICTVGNVQLAVLSPDDLDRICQATYQNVTAVAIQDGQGNVPAYRWRCYGR